MGRRRRFLASSTGAVIGFVAAGRLLARRHPPGADRPDGQLLGAVRGTPKTIRGPLSSRIYAESFAGRSGETVVLTHGWCVTEAIWHYQKEALGTGPDALSLVTWDLPGHGHSTALPAGRLTLERGIDCLARVVDECVEGDAVLVGHSLGGVLTLGYLLAHPETARRRVRGVVLAGTPLVHLAGAAAGRWRGSSAEARMIGRVMQFLVENRAVDRWFSREVGSADPRAASYRLIRTGFGPRPSPAQIRFVRDLAASVPPTVRADTFRAMTGFDFRPELPRVKVPVLVAIGGRDRLVDPEESRALAALMPRSRVEEFPEAGHALFLEQHERFNDLVRRFAVRRLRNGRRGTATRQRVG